MWLKKEGKGRRQIKKNTENGTKNRETKRRTEERNISASLTH